ncbi:MAG TPA: DNA gyrase subunit A [Chloroflexota bacterium]|nr:DNA gyrase subunit A [Chloroflexota bacterium]
MAGTVERGGGPTGAGAGPDPAGEVKLEEFGALLERAFATYGLSVVTDRALPDARDGLKPVQRRILYCMWVARFLSTRPTVKSAEVVGRVLGDYHPHSDTSVYDAAVRMAQEFTMRYPLIDGQGNFGSIDEDPAAAYRYTEMRLSALGELLLRDIEKETVPLKPTYKQDPKVVEPEYLPARIPPVCNPSEGIAVGLSTRIPPHNLAETLQACIALLDQPQMSVLELMKHIKGPDFPGGGVVIGEEGIREYLATGKGRLAVRGVVKLEEGPRQRSLVISELPPVSKARLKASLVKAFNERRLDGLVPDVRDESDTEKGVRIVLDVKRDGDPAQMLNALHKYSELQTSVPVQMVYLLGDSWQPARQPKQIGMVELLNHYNAHQLDVLQRRSRFELEQAEQRLHVVLGLIIGAANAQEIVRIFQASRDRNEAKEQIRARYRLSEVQAQVIAEMTLAQVTRLDASRYAAEKKELTQRIAALKALLGSRERMVATVKAEMEAVIDLHGDPRRTRVDREGDASAEVTEVTPSVETAPVLVALATDGGAKTVAPGAYRRPITREVPLLALVPASTTSFVLLPTDRGRVFVLRAHEVPEAARPSRGEPLRKLARLEPGERPLNALATPDLYAVADGQTPAFLTLFTAQGRVKKSLLEEYRGAGQAGVLDFKLAPGDAVVAACLADGEGEYLVLTSDGKALRFGQPEVRPTGRGTQGVAGITLARGARVIGAFPVQHGDGGTLALFAPGGVGKRTPLAEFPVKGRATSGVQAATGGLTLAAATIIPGPPGGSPSEGDGPRGDVLVSTGAGRAIRLAARAIPRLGRPSRGNQLLQLEPGDSVAGALLLPPEA